MFEAMERARGLGLAAVQVGELIRLFITLVPRDKPRVFINPDILETSIEEVPYEEGCLSIPGRQRRRRAACRGARAGVEREGPALHPGRSTGCSRV